MRKFFWGRAAAFFSSTLVRDLIVKSAFKRPHHFQLVGYMSRWWLIPRMRWLPFAVRIHFIRREDKGEHPHNHPGSFRTFILSGWYVEQRGAVYYNYHRGDSAFVRKDEFHHICHVSEKGCMTMVIEWGRWGKDWGFTVDGEYVDHEDYHYPR